MYKLVIADDDEWIREGMKRNIPWGQGNIQVAGVTADGEEAWELIQRIKPDILLSDIRMPFMDGLKLARLVRDHGLDMKVVFLTGYDDFTYAKEAVQLQVFDYILKYEENDKILQAVVGAAKALEEERRKHEKEKKSHGLIVNQFFSGMIAGVGSEETIERDSKLLGLSFCGAMFGMAVLAAENVGRFLKPNKPEDMELLLFSLKNLICEVLESEMHQDVQVHVIQYNHRINLLFNFPIANLEKLKQDAAHISRILIKSISEYLKVDAKIGIGSFGKGFGHIAGSYEEALIATQMKGVLAEQDVIFHDEIKFSSNSHQAILKTITDYIAEHFHNENLDLKEVAEKVHITPSYVSTLFKKYTDVNFSEYVMRVRMEKAIELLVHTDLKVFEVAERIGYPNTQYFSVLFKRYTAHTPIAYRQQYQ
jgi:two-component system response regulator YesN